MFIRRIAARKAQKLISPGALPLRSLQLIFKEAA